MITTNQIIIKHRQLCRKANELHPALKSKGSNHSWDDYYKAVQDIKDFENKQWEDGNKQ